MHNHNEQTTQRHPNWSQKQRKEHKLLCYVATSAAVLFPGEIKTLTVYVDMVRSQWQSKDEHLQSSDILFCVMRCQIPVESFRNTYLGCY